MPDRVKRQRGLGAVAAFGLTAALNYAASGLIDGGADTFLIETCQDILQVKCAINACLAALAERKPKAVAISARVGGAPVSAMVVSISVRMSCWRAVSLTGSFMGA